MVCNDVIMILDAPEDTTCGIYVYRYNHMSGDDPGYAILIYVYTQVSQKRLILDVTKWKNPRDWDLANMKTKQRVYHLLSTRICSIQVVAHVAWKTYWGSIMQEPYTSLLQVTPVFLTLYIHIFSTYFRFFHRLTWFASQCSIAIFVCFNEY